MNKIAFVTGANRGLGFEFVKQLLHQNYRVIATARNIAESHELMALLKTNPNLCEFHPLDVTNNESLDHLKIFSKKLPKIDLLINNAGTFGSPGKTLDSQLQDYENVFKVNVLGPLELCRACWPLLEKSESPVSAMVTSLMGSICENSSGSYGPYRVSKAALNMFSKNLSIDYPKICSVVLHPGWVQTRMGGKEAPLTPHQSVEGMLKVLTGLQPSDSGKFFDYSGKILAW